MIIFEILKIVLPPITAGAFTLFITKYTYNKNRPLDKLEIAYNRVYYPIYRFIKRKENNKKIEETISEINYTFKIYFDKYEKYIDFSTIRTFNELCQCKTLTEKKSAYRKFVNNIYDMNSYLRKRLGYLEPNLLQLYKYTQIRTQITLWIILLLAGIYICFFLGMMFTGEIQKIFATILGLFVFITFILIIIRFIMFLYYRFIK